MTPSQPKLFSDDPNCGRPPIEHNQVPVRNSTFIGGVEAKVHRWFRLTPSFGPELVRKALNDMDTPPRSVVLDPFAGAGTALIEAKLAGHRAIGYELNPLLHFVSEISLNWTLDPSELRKDLLAIRTHVKKTKLCRTEAVSLEALGLTPPPIHNPFRWWREDVLVDLLTVMAAIDSVSSKPEHRQFFRLALAGVLVPDLTNVTLGRLQLHFINRDHDEIDVWKTFQAHALKMVEDLSEVALLKGLCAAQIFHTDSTNPVMDSGLPLVDRVVTSPPYPNRYSYVWNTRPHLYLLGFFENAGQASKLDLSTIGGTWGSATSVLGKGCIEPKYPVIERVVSPVTRAIGASDGLMANYVMKYFNLLAQQIVALDEVIASDAQIAYVVGCSRIKGVYVETDVLLADIFEGLGYRVKRIERFRRRHSGKDLHESTVYAAKS